MCSCIHMLISAMPKGVPKVAYKMPGARGGEWYENIVIVTYLHTYIHTYIHTYNVCTYVYIHIPARLSESGESILE